MLGVLLALLLNAALARFLSPGEMGGYVFAFSLLSIAVAFAQLGLPLTIVRLLADAGVSGESGRVDAVGRPLLLLGLIGALLGGLLFLLAVSYLAEPSGVLFAHRFTLAVWLVVLAFGGLLAEFFRGLHAIREATLFGGLFSSLLLGLILLVLSGTGASVTVGEIFFWSGVAAALNMVVSAMLLRLRRPRLLGSIPEGGAALRQAAAHAAPTWILGLVTLFMSMSQVDVLVLGLFRGDEEVAVYGAAARLVMLVMVSLLMVNAVVSPLIAELHTAGRKAELERLLRRTAALAAIPAFVALVLMMACGAWLLQLVYGQYYSGGALVLTILAAGQLFNVYSGSCNLVLVMTGHQRESLRINLFCGAVALAAFLAVAENGGPIGVALVMAALLVARNGLMLLAVRRTVGIRADADVVGLVRYLGGRALVLCRRGEG